MRRQGIKRQLCGVLPFVLGLGLGLWLFRWWWGGDLAAGWGQVVYRFGVSWYFTLDRDFDGKPDCIEYVRPRRALWVHLLGNGPAHNPDYREIVWKIGPVRRVRVWFQPPVNHNVTVASVGFRRGPEITVVGQDNLCLLLQTLPLPPFGFGPGVEELGCGVVWPLL